VSSAVLKNILDFLKTIDPFDKLLLQEVEYIAKNIKVIYLAKDQQLELNQTEKEKYLYIIRSGAVEQINPDGSCVPD
jgi:CBS domain-containing protein